MKLVIQKVSHASVETEGASIAEIQKGFLVLVGIGKNDTKETIDQYVKKMVNLRIFTDENGKTNLSLKDVNGEILLVPYMPTVRRETAQASLMRENLKRRNSFMNIW